MGLLITFALGLFFGLGILISKMASDNKKIIQISIAVAFGTLASLSVLELVPEALENMESMPTWMMALCVAAGIVGLRILDHFIPHHDGFHRHNHHRGESVVVEEEQDVVHIGIMSTIAVTLHNIIEGMAVYGISQESLSTGVIIAFGVGLHNVPMGLIIASTLQKEKKAYQIALFLLASLSTFIGGLVMYMLWGAIPVQVIGILISITFGMILYIVIFELIPMLLHMRAWHITIPAVLVGVALMVISTLFE